MRSLFKPMLSQPLGLHVTLVIWSVCFVVMIGDGT